MPVHLYLTGRMHWMRQYLLVVLLAVGWVYMTREYYSYNKGFALFFGLSTFPITTRIMGFMAVYGLHDHAMRYFKIHGFWRQFLFFSIPFAVLHVFLEKIGYDYLGIHNVITASYPGLPFCDCLHAPSWMQTGYLLLGPLFFTLAYGLNANKRIFSEPNNQ